MGLDNPIHIAFLLILLLLVFGAKRLPEMGKSLGSGMRGFKDSLSGEGTQSTLTVQQHEAAAAAAGTQAPTSAAAATLPAAAAVPVQVPAPALVSVGEPTTTPAA